MNVIYRKSEEMERSSLNLLFNLYLFNMNKYEDSKRKEKDFKNPAFKDSWLNEILNNNKVRLLIYLNNEELVGFVIFEENEDNTFIFDFQINPKYLNDGTTFNSMITNGFNYIPIGKEVVGVIWKENEDAKKAFESIGATLRKRDNISTIMQNITNLKTEANYSISYDKLKEWVQKQTNL